MIQLNLNFNQVGEEREERGERESHSEERNESKLNDRFIVVVYKLVIICFHNALSWDGIVHLQIALFNFISDEFRSFDLFLEQLVNLFDRPSDNDLFWEPFEDIDA